MFLVSLVTVVAALIVIMVAVALAETTLVYIALGLAGLSAALLMAEVVRYRESLGVSALLERARQGFARETEPQTDGLGKASVSAAPAMAATAAQEARSGTSAPPASAEEPVRGAVLPAEETGPPGSGVSEAGRVHPVEAHSSEEDVPGAPEEATAESVATGTREEPADGEATVAAEGEAAGGAVSTPGSETNEDEEREASAPVPASGDDGDDDAVRPADTARVVAGVEEPAGTATAPQAEVVQAEAEAEEPAPDVEESDPDDADLSTASELPEEPAGETGADTSFSAFVERLQQGDEHVEKDGEPADPDPVAGPADEDADTAADEAEGADTAEAAETADTPEASEAEEQAESEGEPDAGTPPGAEPGAEATEQDAEAEPSPDDSEAEPSLEPGTHGEESADEQADRAGEHASTSAAEDSVPDPDDAVDDDTAEEDSVDEAAGESEQAPATGVGEAAEETAAAGDDGDRPGEDRRTGTP